MEEGRVILDI